ncbi:hypothetical protein ACLOJK_004873 [Asimina triloba]
MKVVSNLHDLVGEWKTRLSSVVPKGGNLKFPRGGTGSVTNKSAMGKTLEGQCNISNFGGNG